MYPKPYGMLKLVFYRKNTQIVENMVMFMEKNKF